MLTHVYLAHPFGGEDLNLAKAEQVYAVLSHCFPDHVFIANWIHHCRAFVDADPEHRALGMMRNFSEIERADEIWATSLDETVTISSSMRAELNHAKLAGKIVRRVSIKTTPLTPTAREASIYLDPPIPHVEKTQAC